MPEGSKGAMMGGISAELLPRLSDLVAERMGLHFPQERWRDLERGMHGAAREFGFADAKACVEWLSSSRLTKSQIEVLASHLTVGETYFFREKNTFAALEGQVLPALVRLRRESNRRFRLWSAGCCTGEEPYSLAILIREMIPDLPDWNVTILATDINPRFLQKASEGIYGEWSFRETPRWLQEKYFRKKGTRFELLSDVRKMVLFSYLNLGDDGYPSLWNNTNAMDIIFCRNVLMYFGPGQARNAAQNLYCALVDGGWLIVSSSEASQVLFSRFATVHFAGAILYRKNASRPPVVEVFPQAAPDVPDALLPPPFEFPAEAEPEDAHAPETAVCAMPEVAEQGPGETPATAYEQALALYGLGRYEGAAGMIRTWLAANQEEAPAMILLARACANEGNLAEALEWCEKAIATDKLNAGHHYLRATILQEQGRVEEAVASLKRALYLDPDFALAYFTLGHIRLRQERVKESARQFENALSVLGKHRLEEILPESEGITAGRLAEIIRLTVPREACP